ncbi:MAG: 50S ribosomal protein L31 [Candidatus Arsenophonus melophagi]|nr:50S ribosomal protein L31 [Candidatus Arsenophonus melophagi]
MKKDIHPQYTKVIATCSCGNVMHIKSTINHSFNLDVCGKCHPFYTHKQRDMASSGRVDRFKRRFNIPDLKNNNR